MVVYEVNQEMSADVFEAFKKWFVEIHAGEMLEHKGFLEARVCVEQDDSDNKKRTTCYYLLDARKSLDDYLQHHAALMTQQLTDEFGDKVKLRRRISDVLVTVKAPNN